MSDSAPPAFGDLGSQADSLFNSGFNYGFYGLKCTTVTRKELEFAAEIKKEHESNEITGELSTTLVKNKAYGLTVNQTWTTDNELNTSASVDEPFSVQGFTLGVDNSYKPNSKEQSTTVKSSYQSDNLNLELDYDISAKSVNLASVLGIEGYLAGFKLDYDVSNKKLGDYTLAIGADLDDITCHAAVTNLSDFSGSMYRKVNHEIETGAFINYSKEGGSQFGMAAKYVPHEDTAFTGKINNSGELGLSFQQEVTPGVSLNLSTLIQSKNFQAGGHKVGVGIELNP